MQTFITHTRGLLILCVLIFTARNVNAQAQGDRSLPYLVHKGMKPKVNKNVSIAASDSSNVTLIGFFATGTEANNVAVKDTIAYVADGTLGVLVIDISDPANPTQIGVYGNRYAYDIVVSGNYAYVLTYFDNGLAIIDISNSSMPFEAGFMNLPGIPQGIFLSGNYVYVADGSSGLRIIDISDPTNPTEAGFYDDNFNANGVSVSGNYAYVADVMDGLTIIDISDPVNPVETGSYVTPLIAEDVAVSGNYAYIANGDSLRIIDISDPFNPTETGYYGTDSYALDVKESGNYAYLAAEYAGIRIIDISDPINPNEAGYYVFGNGAYDVAVGVAVRGNYIYAAVYGGLYILRNDLVTGIHDNLENLPEAFRLAQNYPNPFNPETTIPFVLSGSPRFRVRVEIYNILGQRVRSLLNTVMPGGEHSVRWDGRNDGGNPVASGVYIYRLRVSTAGVKGNGAARGGVYQHTRKMVLLR